MLNLTKYYDEFLRYHSMAKWQQSWCNIGNHPYSVTPFDDDLIKNVFLYDVVERKYAGFSQLLLDMWYDLDEHPYSHKMDTVRKCIVSGFDKVRSYWNLEEWLYVFFVHRLTGSGINYGSHNSGYHNSMLLHFHDCYTITDMARVFKSKPGPKFTSQGYQIAPFPKPRDGYEKGGEWFICEILPMLCMCFSDYLQKGDIKDFRTMMDTLEAFNKQKGFKVLWFQYAAVLADIADFFPHLVHKESHFFYGKNAKECLNYLAIRPKGQKPMDFYDELTDQIMKDTGSLPYNSEDIACDFIRWVENYINPKGDYSHLNLDEIWSSCRIGDHPFGRQKMMLELGLVNTFNGKPHPSDDKILKSNNMTVEEYKDAIL